MSRFAERAELACSERQCSIVGDPQAEDAALVVIATAERRRVAKLGVEARIAQGDRAAAGRDHEQRVRKAHAAGPGELPTRTGRPCERCQQCGGKNEGGEPSPYRRRRPRLPRAEPMLMRPRAGTCRPRPRRSPSGSSRARRRRAARRRKRCLCFAYSRTH